MPNPQHLSLSELEAGLEYIRLSPKDAGVLRMIVSRPDDDEREIIETGELDSIQGLVGDNWKARGNRHSPDGSANINVQITVMNARTIELLAQSKERWSLAGDQLYVDIDLSDENMSPGTQLEVGQALIEVTSVPHTGCNKFAARYGTDATKFVNSPEGKRLHLRGINAKIVQGGAIHTGDVVRKL